MAEAINKLLIAQAGGMIWKGTEAALSTHCVVRGHRRGAGQMALLFWLLLSLLWGGGCLFELQEAIQELQSENTQLQGKIQNLTEALSELRLFVWNQSQGETWASEPQIPSHHQHNPNLCTPKQNLMPSPLT